MDSYKIVKIILSKYQISKESNSLLSSKCAFLMWLLRWLDSKNPLLHVGQIWSRFPRFSCNWLWYSIRIFILKYFLQSKHLWIRLSRWSFSKWAITLLIETKVSGQYSHEIILSPDRQRWKRSWSSVNASRQMIHFFDGVTSCSGKCIRTSANDTMGSLHT